jgi:hypothetical protein
LPCFKRIDLAPKLMGIFFAAFLTLWERGVAMLRLFGWGGTAGPYRPYPKFDQAGCGSRNWKATLFARQHEVATFTAS